ncbi:flagellar protein FlaG [Clostridium cochlearium]|uniref:Flagellar protein FlaG n=1 Tax=Clostridium cochlearium TaxID=1494 RepID=A0A7Y3XZ11_CLOCO|nr:flagellar protein FlaG [Clostridium cochlearium]NOH16429.1 flagellar protein FlaG [Clostridium cochlearium]
MEVNIVSQGRHTATLNGNGVDNLEIVVPQSSVSEVNIPKGESRGALAKDRGYTLDEVKKAADKLNKLFEDKSTYVEYEVYGKSKSITIKILNNKTKEVVKEIPPKKLIDMVDKLCELAGIFVDQKA